MSKISIKRSQIIAENGDSVKYITDEGSLVESPRSDVSIDEPEAVAVPTESAEPVKPKRARAKKEKPAKASSEKPSRKQTQAANEGETEVASKKTKTKAKAKAKANEAGVRTINGKAVDISQYSVARAPGGGKSFNCGDDVAAKLEGKTLDEVYTYAAKTLKVEERELRSKYKHLNPGMQRMNLGNRLRKTSDKKAA